MPRDQLENWMWAEAVEMLSRAERMHRRFFQPHAPALEPPAWEPPVDVLETDDEVMVYAALPGVDPDKVQTSIEDGVLVISGRRSLPPQLRTAKIHRLELPQGRFERRVPIPPGRYDGVRSAANPGCLLVSLRKAR